MGLKERAVLFVIYLAIGLVAVTATVTVADAQMCGWIPRVCATNQAPVSQIPDLPQSKVTNLTSDLALKVNTSTTVSGHSLGSNVTLGDGDISLADVSTNDVSTSRHGWCPKLPNDATKYLDGTGIFSVPAGGGGGSTWTTAYTVDFSTLTAQNLLTGGDGAKTIDGKTWYLTNSGNAQTVYLNDGTHTGLYIRCNSNSSNNTGTTLSGPAMYANLSSLSSAVSRADYYNDVRVSFIFSQPHTPNANYEYAAVAFIDWPGSGTFVYNTIHRYAVEWGYAGGLNRGNGQICFSGSSVYGSSFSGTSGTYRVATFFASPSVVRSFAYEQSSYTTWPETKTMTYVEAGNRQYPNAKAWSGNAVWVSALSVGSMAASDLLVHKILVEYR